MSNVKKEQKPIDHVILDFVLSVSMAQGQKCVINFSRAFPFVNVPHFLAHSGSVRVVLLPEMDA